LLCYGFLWLHKEEEKKLVIEKYAYPKPNIRMRYLDSKYINFYSCDFFFWLNEPTSILA